MLSVPPMSFRQYSACPVFVLSIIGPCVTCYQLLCCRHAALLVWKVILNKSKRTLQFLQYVVKQIEKSASALIGCSDSSQILQGLLYILTCISSALWVRVQLLIELVLKLLSRTSTCRWHCSTHFHAANSSRWGRFVNFLQLWVVVCIISHHVVSKTQKSVARCLLQVSFELHSVYCVFCSEKFLLRASLISGVVESVMHLVFIRVSEIIDLDCIV